MAKIAARINVFETNSSGAHCFCWMDDYDMQRFLNGEFYIAADNGNYEEGQRISPERREKLFHDYLEAYSGDTLNTEKQTRALFAPREGIMEGKRLKPVENPSGCWKKWESPSKEDPNRERVNVKTTAVIYDEPEDTDPAELKRVDFCVKE